MSSSKKFSIFCVTEGTQVVTGFQEFPPTTCPNNPAHEVRADTVSIVDDPLFATDWQSVESDSESTTTSSTSWQDKVSLTTPDLIGTFIILYSVEIKTNVPSSKVTARCMNTTDDTALITSSCVETDYGSFGSSSVVVFSGASKSFKIQFRSQVDGKTSFIKNARMSLWRVS